MTAPGTVLLVEDSADDALLVSRAFKQVGIRDRLVIVSDGEQAIEYLKGQGPYKDRERFPIPRIVLLDLGMPRLTGFHVLLWIRQEPQSRHLPVIVLTGSAGSPEVKRAYQLGANSFLLKPVDGKEFAVAIKQMSDFWLGRCEL